MEYIGIYHAAASGRKQYFSLRRIIFNAAAFYIKKFHCPVPVPRYITPDILVKFCPRSDIGEIFFKAGKQFFFASGIKFNALDIFHVCSPAHPGCCIDFLYLIYWNSSVIVNLSKQFHPEDYKKGRSFIACI